MPTPTTQQPPIGPYPPGTPQPPVQPPVYGPPTQPAVTAPGSDTDPGMLGNWYQESLNGPRRAATYNAARARTTDWKVGKNQTVQGQVNNIVDADGVLMQQAATRGLQNSNSRGLLNSSLGVQASQAALYDAAMPMAQQDAQTYADRAAFNADAKNTTSIQNAEFRNDARSFNADARNERRTGMFDAATDLYNNREQREFEQGENRADRKFRTREREGGQDFTAGENAADREFTAGENSADREFTTGERLSGQQFTAGENATNRAWENANREDTQQFNSGESAAERSWKSGERIAGQEWTAGETALNRAWETGERISSQDYDAAQATLDRDQQSKIQTLQEQGMTERQATEIASRERMLTAQQTFDSEQLGKEQEFVVTRDATAFESQLALMDQNAGTNLATEYRAASTEALTKYQEGVMAIQTSDMDEDVKVAQIAALGTIYQNSMNFTNVMYENSPGWSDEWATISGEFVEDEEG